MTEHKQVRVRVGNVEADVDEQLAPLIAELWKAGISTVMSCQENRPGVAWIMFWMPGDLCRFLDIVGEYEPEGGSLYRRIKGGDGPDEGGWEYALWPDDAGLYEEETDDGIVEWHEGEVYFYFSPSVRFPRTDLPVLLERMKRFNEVQFVPCCPDCPDGVVLDELDFGDGSPFGFGCPACGDLFTDAEVLWEEQPALLGDQTLEHPRPMIRSAQEGGRHRG